MKKYFLLALYSLLPLCAFADFSLGTGGMTFKSVVGYVVALIYMTIPILSTLAFLLFFWGLSKFVIASGNQADLDKGKQYMLWGIIALFVLISFQAILSLATNEFFGKKIDQPLLPTGGDTPQTDSTIHF